jgi:hypothetical protein
MTEPQRAFYTSAVEQLNTVSADRQTRIEAAEIDPRNTRGADNRHCTGHGGDDSAGQDPSARCRRCLVISVAVIVGLGWFTALLLEYPFSGTISVSTARLCTSPHGRSPGSQSSPKYCRCVSTCPSSRVGAAITPRGQAEADRHPDQKLSRTPTLTRITPLVGYDLESHIVGALCTC